MAQGRLLGARAPAVRRGRREVQVVTADAAASFAEPDVRVVRGQPTEAEVAAVIAVLAARACAATALALAARPAAASRSEWSSRSRLVRHPMTAGPGAWRRSALPG
ncbi:MAG TPA: acyl-CoA carboxylase epsilon subunit [Streptosporangiaceae bacterium]|nr:acyl-CoA carboxylase epsilon subunit [Streptosporangiaceae bacterium]